jgi:hypothetical protein
LAWSNWKKFFLHLFIIVIYTLISIFFIFEII